jgi:uncharacterized protein YndB with AHSA1/START domain
MTDTITQPLALQLERTIAGTREEVFDAWTNPEVLRRWWAAGPDWSTPVAEVDLQVGGRYRLTMRDSEGAEHTVAGVYTEIDRPARLSYTWAWDPAPEGDEWQGETLVTVEFREAGAQTTVQLTHSGFATEHVRDMHAHGWEACVGSLERAVFAAS